MHDSSFSNCAWHRRWIEKKGIFFWKSIFSFWWNWPNSSGRVAWSSEKWKKKEKKNHGPQNNWKKTSNKRPHTRRFFTGSFMKTVDSWKVFWINVTGDDFVKVFFSSFKKNKNKKPKLAVLWFWNMEKREKMVNNSINCSLYIVNSGLVHLA